MVTCTRSPLCGSVEVMTASVPSMNGIPNASIAHIAYARTVANDTTCGVGVGENGYAATSRPCPSTATRSSAARARSTVTGSRPAASAAKLISAPVGTVPVTAKWRRIAWCTCRSPSGSRAARRARSARVALPGWAQQSTTGTAASAGAAAGSDAIARFRAARMRSAVGRSSRHAVPLPALPPITSTPLTNTDGDG